MRDSLISPEMRGAIGRTEELRGEVHKKEFQRWAAAVGDLNQLYFDEAFAKSHGHRDVVMPPMFISRVTNGVTFLSELRPDGISSRDFPNIPLLERSMAGGEEIYFYRCAYPGDELTATRKLVNLEQKQGKSGAFVLVTWQTSYVNQRAEFIAELIETWIGR